MSTKVKTTKVMKYKELITRTESEINKELLANNASKKPIQKYFNNVVTTDDKNFVYVNNYGYTHKYSNEAYLLQYNHYR